MRVLFTSTPGWGHIHPMVPLARAFEERGDDVLWATAAEAVDRLGKEGFRAESAGLPVSVAMPAFRDRYPEAATLPPAELPAFMFQRFFGAVRAAPMVADLVPIAEAWQPDLLVCDQAELAGPIVAAMRGVKNVTHAFGAVLPPARLEAAAEYVEPLWRENGLEPPPLCGCYEHLYLDIYPPSLQPGEHAHLGATQSLRPVTFAGTSDDPLPDWVTEASPAPLVYVTMGTVFRNDDVLATVVETLRDLDVRVVVTVGPDGDPGVLGEQPPKVHVARYIPQDRLLPHCALVVSHAGSGTFLAALAAAIPQLCLPQAADQFLNAAACDRSGVGLTFGPGTVTVDALREAISRLLTDGSIRETAALVSKEIAAMPTPDEVAERLHAWPW